MNAQDYRNLCNVVDWTARVGLLQTWLGTTDDDVLDGVCDAFHYLACAKALAEDTREFTAPITREYCEAHLEGHLRGALRKAAKGAN